MTKDRQFKGNAQKAITSDSDHSLKAAPNREGSNTENSRSFEFIHFVIVASLTTILHYSPFSISQFYLQHPSSLSHSLYIGNIACSHIVDSFYIEYTCFREACKCFHNHVPFLDNPFCLPFCPLHITGLFLWKYLPDFTFNFFNIITFFLCYWLLPTLTDTTNHQS